MPHNAQSLFYQVKYRMENALGRRKYMLQVRGYRVLAVRSAQDALDLLQEAVPGAPNASPFSVPDLIVADLLLPQMDGNELVRRAKEMHPTLPALLFSGTVTTYERALAADAFLPKGAGTSVELLEKVRVLMMRKRGRKKQSLGPRAVGTSETESEVAA